MNSSIPSSSQQSARYSVGAGMHRMKIRVITDRVFLQRRDDILPVAPFEHARLFTHHFERRMDAAFCQHFREAFAGVVIGNAATK